MIMEFISNDIKKMIKHVEADQFEEMHIKIILYNLLCAMNFVHSANIMHRDIKPANLLVDDSCQIKLCDFGQARTVLLDPFSTTKKLTSETFWSTAMTEAESSPEESKGEEKNIEDREKHRKMLSNHVCSRWYRPPEVILTQKYYNQKIDIWGLGCVLAEMLFVIQNGGKCLDSPDHKKSSASRSEKSPKGRVKKLSDKYLLPGLSCFPLSPFETNDKGGEDE